MGSKLEHRASRSWTKRCIDSEEVQSHVAHDSKYCRKRSALNICTRTTYATSQNKPPPPHSLDPSWQPVALPKQNPSFMSIPNPPGQTLGIRERFRDSEIGAHSEGSPGGSNCTMVVTDGKSRPRAATSVQSSTPELHLLNSRKVAVRTACNDTSNL